jgi:Integrase core domain
LRVAEQRYQAVLAVIAEPSPKICASVTSRYRVSDDLRALRFDTRPPRTTLRPAKDRAAHRTLRAEFGNRRAFTSPRVARRAHDEWVRYRNTTQPHQAMDMATPASRFAARPEAGQRPADLSALTPGTGVAFALAPTSTSRAARIRVSDSGSERGAVVRSQARSDASIGGTLPLTSADAPDLQGSTRVRQGGTAAL